MRKGSKVEHLKLKQTADRRHILKNLGEALEGVFLSKKSLLKAAMTDPASSTFQLAETSRGSTKHREKVRQPRHQELVERHRKIHELFAKKVDLATIGRQVGISRQTVYRYLQMDQSPERRSLHQIRTHLLEPFKPYFIKHWNDGCRNASDFYREIVEDGYTASMANVTRFIRNVHTTKSKPRGFKFVAPTPEATATE